LNDLFSNDNRVDIVFNLHFLENKPKNTEEFLLLLFQNMSAVKANNPKSINTTLLEIPTFYLMEHPMLFAFRMFVYSRNIWELENYGNKKFNLEDYYNPKVKNILEQVCSIYFEFPSQEIWSSFIVDAMINQIQYHLSLELFHDKNDALLMIEELKQMNNKFFEYTSKNTKFLTKQDGTIVKSSFELFQIEFLTLNNTFIANCEKSRFVFYTFDSPNLMMSTDSKLFDYTMNWFERIKVRSAALDMGSERNRFRFFNRIENKINAAEREIRFSINA
jgi:hypothetical protein